MQLIKLIRPVRYKVYNTGEQYNYQHNNYYCQRKSADINCAIYV